MREEKGKRLHKMSRQETKLQIKQLKQQLKATKQANDGRLVKLALLMVILAAIAAFFYGKITL